MGFYKVTDESLTQVADAIRAKSGKVGELSFPLGFASAIAAISAGGNVRYETGVYVSDSDVRVAVTLPHSLGVVPTITIVFAEDLNALVGNTGYLLSCAGYNFSVNNDCHFVVGTSNPSVTGGYSTQSGFVSDTAFRISASPTYKLKAGVTYRWLILALPEA